MLNLLITSLKFRIFAWLKIPLIGFLRPKIEVLNDTQCKLRIPLTRRSKNHLNCMYFGALSAGADVAGGVIALQHIMKSKEKISFVFKEFHAEFLKRAEGDVIFTCNDGGVLEDLVKRTISSGEREEAQVNVVATCPSKLGETPVAKFQLTISLKKQK